MLVHDLTILTQTCVDAVKSSSENNVVKHSVVGFFRRRPHPALLLRRGCLDPIQEFVFVLDIFDADAFANEFGGPLDVILFAGEDDTIIFSR